MKDYLQLALYAQLGWITMDGKQAPVNAEHEDDKDAEDNDNVGENRWWRMMMKMMTMLLNHLNVSEWRGELEYGWW